MGLPAFQDKQGVTQTWQWVNRCLSVIRKTPVRRSSLKTRWYRWVLLGQSPQRRSASAAVAEWQHQPPCSSRGKKTIFASSSRVLTRKVLRRAQKTTSHCSLSRLSRLMIQALSMHRLMSKRPRSSKGPLLEQVLVDWARRQTRQEWQKRWKPLLQQETCPNK